MLMIAPMLPLASAPTARKKVSLCRCTQRCNRSLLTHEVGHVAKDCPNPRLIDRSDVEDASPHNAWEEVKKASAEKDLDDLRVSIAKYLKVMPDITYSELETAFRSQGLNFYLIAQEKEIADTLTNMDLQGNLDRKYSITWRISPTIKRPKEKASWPDTPEDNIERLKNAGEPVDRGLPKCRQCGKLGHTSKFCTKERIENDKTVVNCYNCEGVGHRVRDCKPTSFLKCKND